jgi:type IV pilus assembly protein PilW
MGATTATAESVSRAGRQQGVTLIEMLVTLLIGAFMTLGAITVFTQSRNSFRTNDVAARLQENARFALSEMEPDLRLAQYWGMTNKAQLLTVPAPLPAVTCGGNNIALVAISAAALANPVQAFDNAFALNGLCAPFNNTWRANTDSLILRHVSGQPTAPTAGLIQVQSTRTAGNLFNNGAPPLANNCPAGNPQTCTYDMQFHVYYIDAQSSLGANVPSLRRLTLGAGGLVQDQEIIAGAEDLQVQFGVDTNNDNSVERYVDPNHPLITVGAPGYNPNARIVAVRVWLLLRAEQAEVGFTNNTAYQYANVGPFTRNDGIRRLLVSQTVMLRNSRG